MSVTSTRLEPSIDSVVARHNTIDKYSPGGSDVDPKNFGRGGTKFYLGANWHVLTRSHFVPVFLLGIAPLRFFLRPRSMPPSRGGNLEGYGRVDGWAKAASSVRGRSPGMGSGDEAPKSWFKGTGNCSSILLFCTICTLIRHLDMEFQTPVA